MLEENRQRVIKYAIEAFEVCKQMKSIHPDQRYQAMMERASEFTKNYPVPARYMCEGLFDAKYFELWLKKLETAPYHSMDEFFQRQADYAKGLCKWLNPKASKKELDIVWNNVYKALDASKKDIEDRNEKAMEEIKNRKKRHLEEKRQELFDFLKTL